MGRIAAFVICLFIVDAYAQEQQPRIPDLSLSPEETYQDFGLMPQNNEDAIEGEPSYNNSQSSSSSRRSSNVENAIPSGSFMAGYCDPKFKPLVENECLDIQRDQICEEFQHLPADAQQVLDNIISCMQSTDEMAANDPACASGDAQRLRLIKKYWQDEGIAHALTFLPDEMVKSSAKCIQERR